MTKSSGSIHPTPSYEAQSDKFYKIVDDAVARFLRSLFLFGTAAFGIGICILIMKSLFQKFSANNTFLEWFAFAVILVSGSIFTVGVIGCLIWAFVNLSGVANALILARQQPPPDRVGKLMGVAHKMFGAGAPLWTLVIFAFAISVCLSVAAATALISQRDWLVPALKAFGIF